MKIILSILLTCASALGAGLQFQIIPGGSNVNYTTITNAALKAAQDATNGLPSVYVFQNAASANIGGLNLDSANPSIFALEGNAGWYFDDFDPPSALNAVRTPAGIVQGTNNVISDFGSRINRVGVTNGAITAASIATTGDVTVGGGLAATNMDVGTVVITNPIPVLKVVTNRTSELEITNGVTIGGERRTSWPTGGTGATYTPDLAVTTYGDTEVAVWTNTVAASNAWALNPLTIIAAGPTNGGYWRQDHFFWRSNNASATCHHLVSNSVAATSGSMTAVLTTNMVGGQVVLWLKGAAGETNAWRVQGLPITTTNGLELAVGPSYLLEENFEGTGTDETQSGTWDFTGLNGGTIDPDFSTSGLGLQGSQCLKITTAGGYTFGIYPTITADEIWGYFQIRCDFIGTSATKQCFAFSTSGADRFTILIDNDVGWAVSHGTVTSSRYNDVNPDTGTTYHVWFRYKAADGGSNGEADLWVSTNSTKPGSPNISMVNGDGANDADRISPRAIFGDEIYYFDRILIDDVAIGSAP